MKGTQVVKVVILFLFIWAAVPRFPLYGQSPLSGEIQKLKDSLAVPSLPAAERGAALKRLARLEILAGDIEAAAESWNGAAFANPAAADYACLLEAVRCHIALGDYAAADGAVQIVLSRAALPALLREGQYLAAVSSSLRSGDGAALASLLDSPEYAAKRPALLYILYRIAEGARNGNGGPYRQRLKRDFPQSPESMIAEENPAVAPAGRPMWFLFSGREGISLAPGALPEPAAVESPSPEGSGAGSGGAVLLQTGLFSREENALSMAERLRRAGFSPLLSRREVNGSSFFVVGVAPGGDTNNMILRLKDAGFEAFPVF
jgi:hypothetical protein